MTTTIKDLEDLEEIEIEMETKEEVMTDTTEEETIFTPIISQILGIEEQLDDLDDYFNQLPTLQSQVDEELSDLLHYIENNDLTPKQSSKMIKLIKEKRAIRRGLCKDYEIKRVYNTHKSKLALDNQRQFFVKEIRKKAKELNGVYKNRQLSDEQIKDLIK